MFKLYVDENLIGFFPNSRQAILELYEAMNFMDADDGSPPIHGKVFFEHNDKKQIVAELILHYPPVEDVRNV